MFSTVVVWLQLLLVPTQALVVTKSHRGAFHDALPTPTNISGVVGYNALLLKSNRIDAAASAPAAAAAAAAPVVASYPWARCSTDPANPVVMDSGEACPSDCPFSQMVEGQSCEKLCVHASQCRQFHPVLFFADLRTMQCTPSCGPREQEQIAGCAECLGPGMCKRCARGLFGITQLELSEDGTRCVNVTLKWWYTFYSMAALLVAALVLYLVLMAWRQPESEKCEEKLKIAQTRREEGRTELMHRTTKNEHMDFWKTNFHRVHTGSKRGGRGIVLYFNWLIFGMIVAFTLAGGNFVAYELSDLGRHTNSPESCMVTDAIETYDEVTVSTYMRSEDSATVHRSARHGTLEGWADWGNKVTEAVRNSVRVVANEAPPTGSIAERYTQFHKRMFQSSIAMYIIVVGGIFAFTVFQLSWVTSRFADSEPHSRCYTAVVSGLPPDLFDGTLLTAFFRDVLKDEDKEALWEAHGGTKKDELKDVPLEDRFHVVGTSIAYDYNLQQEAVAKEIDSWIYDLDLQQQDLTKVSASVATATPQTDATSRGMQTETRGDILLQLKDEVTMNQDHPMFDQALLKFVGLEEEEKPTLHGSGTAFVVFATEAARDAVVALSAERKFPKFTMPEKTVSNARTLFGMPTGTVTTMTSQAGTTTTGPLNYRLALAPAHCEPVSVKWQNFGPFSHFAMKIFLSIFIIFLTIFIWIALSLPSAIFIADLALIPGVRPGFVQNLILGLLIAVGNQLIALVVNLVTSWMGFLYKDSRDVAVLSFAFMGTLVATIFDLSVVAITAHGMVLEDAFRGRDAGYEPVVANEIFGLTVPGYLVLPYLGMPIGEHVLPYFLAKFLIRSHGKVTQRSATQALRSAEFDICWRYSDILNNTTICVVLLFFTSNRAWMVMSVLLLFMAIIYMIDKYLLLYVATPTVYDTHRLSGAFSLWWCLPTTMLAGLISFWGYRSSAIGSHGLCFAWPVFHAVIYLAAMTVLQQHLVQKTDKESTLYPDMIRRLQEEGKPWDFFNTNPVFCLRTRCLGAEATGWKDVLSFQRRIWLQQSGAQADSPKVGKNEHESDECLPFVRGSLRVLSPMIERQGSLSKQV